MSITARTHKHAHKLSFVAAAAGFLFATHANAACEDLAKLPVTDGKITSAVSVPADGVIEIPVFHIPIKAPAAFCRVSVTLTPTPDSAIMSEVWLPDPAKWNGKLFGSGNGGYAGSLAGPMAEMRGVIAQGYAAAGSDLGHETTTLKIDASWAIGHPEKVKDFAYRADHVTAVAAKQIIQGYYNAAPKFSYFRGCSNGGHEALMEALKFPGDYDGIVAGAPANSWTHLMTDFMWNETALAKPESKLPEDKLAIVQKAVLDKCDALDGAKDGIINDPAKCRFNPKVLLCKTGEAADCLTRAQVDALRKIYEGPADPVTHKHIYPGFAPGGEALAHNWTDWITSDTASQAQFANQFFGSIVAGDPNWDFHTFDFHGDVARADSELGPVINSNDPDLSAFMARGGKLILFQGWDDAAVAPQGTIDYYKSIREKLGAAQAGNSVRLFMAPGMMHCGGGPGPGSFDTLAAVQRWRENGSAPESMIATRYDNPIAVLTGMPAKALATRPVCAYPAVPHWNGKGSYDDAQNYTCVTPGKR